jgi:signal transduction histidine kinase
VPYRAFRNKLTASYIAPFVIALAVLAGIILWRLADQVSINRWVEHTDRVILTAKDTELALRDVQLSYRAYLQSSDKRYLSEFAGARSEFEGDLSKMAAEVADNAEQLQRLRKINDLQEHWFKTIDTLIGRKDNRQLTAGDLVQVRSYAEAIFGALEDFIADENRFRSVRAARQESEYRIIFILVPLLSGLAVLFLGYYGWRQIQLASEQFYEALEIAESARIEAERARNEAENERSETEKARTAAEESSRKAEEASRAKDTFIGTVSHELKNPLNSIMLWSSALQRDPALGEKAQEGLAAIERAAKAQAQLIEDLLDISRIESGRMRLEIHLIDLAEVVKAGVESIRIAAEAKSITLRESYDPRVGPIAGDAGRLQQVVWNLVSNAVKFTPHGGEVRIRVERINSHAEIIVADTGRGIEPAALESVFDRFWQQDSAGESRHGVGLGLSIVKEIVSMHGGTVSANSAGAGKGSTFTVRLPLAASVDLSGDPDGDSRTGQIGAGARLGKG